MTEKTATSYKSPPHKMTQTTSTTLWNDSASLEELKYSIDHGAVGATCNPVIVVGVLKKEMARWTPCSRQLIDQMSKATEDQIGWQLGRELLGDSAATLRPISDQHHGRNGRLSIQT